jgi:WD40 repeat protein
MIQMNKNTIIVGGDQKIYFFDTNTYEKIADIKYSYWIYSLLKINDESFIIGDKEGNLCQFNFITKKRISTKSKVHNSDKIYSIVIFNNYLVSGGNQTIIKIWK